MVTKLQRANRWVSERAAIKAEVNQAKETVDLVRMAHAITRLDALHAEIEAVEKAKQERLERQTLRLGGQICDTESVLRPGWA